MAVDRTVNRKLLVSVFNPQEAREAVLGGGRIIDSEDPRSALGNIKPRDIMAISDAVLNYQRDLQVQLSTNIGEDQLLFDRSQETGRATQKSPYEIAGKASQSAIGVACAMGTRVHPCNLVKVGVDGMEVALVEEVLEEVVRTLNRTEQFCHSQVMSVLFAQDMDLWDERKRQPWVRRELVGLREFYQALPDSDPDDPHVFDLVEDRENYAVGTVRKERGEEEYLFTDPSQVSLPALIRQGVLPDGSNHSRIKLNELYKHENFFPHVGDTGRRTTKAVIKAMVDATARAGADSIMLDTRIQSKVARICGVDTASDGLIDVNRFDKNPADRPRKGILTLDEIRYFVEYCHYKGVEANVAGSVQSYQAQQLWVDVPELDQISTRGAASAVGQEPGAESAGGDTRQHRVIKRSLVRGLAPPEHGGVLNIPASMKDNPEAMEQVRALIGKLKKARDKFGWPELESYFVDRYGNPEPIR